MKSARQLARAVLAEVDASKGMARELDSAIDVAMDAAMAGRRDEGRVIGAQISATSRTTIARKARAKLAKRSLFHFFVQGWHVLEPDVALEISWHHKLVCDVIQGVLMDWLRKQRTPSFRQRFKSAIFNMPPGTTKSRIISVYAPAWMWLHRPSWTCLCLSANPDVAVRDAGFSRDLIESDWYRDTFGITWTVREDVNAKGKFRNTVGGERTSRGLTSKIVGNRADAIFIDDPNDMHEVFSEASRREVNSKFDNAVYNRVNDQRSSVRFLMQQRGHEDDLSGHWLRQGTKSLMHVFLPMEFDPSRRFQSIFGSDPRNDNKESLHPARFDEEFLKEERERLGTFGFEAQYNQTPGSLDGEMFSRGWFRFFSLVGRPSEGYERPLGTRDAPPAVAIGTSASGVSRDEHWSKRAEFEQIIVTVDATFGSESDAASAVGLGVVGVIGANRYILDDRTDTMTFPQMLRALVDTLDDYPAVKKSIIERKANGNAIIQLLGAEISGLIGVEPQGGYQARAHAMSPSFESGNWYLLEGARWLNKLVDELTVFPNGKRDDRVDMLSQLHAYLAEKPHTAKNKWRAMARRRDKGVAA